MVCGVAFYDRISALGFLAGSSCNRRLAVLPGSAFRSGGSLIRATLKSNAQIARFVSDRGAGADDGLPSQLAKVYEELTGNKLAALGHEPHLARHAHARSHGLALV